MSMYTLYTLTGSEDASKLYLRCGQGNPLCLTKEVASARIEITMGTLPDGVTMHKEIFIDNELSKRVAS